MLPSYDEQIRYGYPEFHPPFAPSPLGKSMHRPTTRGQTAFPSNYFQSLQTTYSRSNSEESGAYAVAEERSARGDLEVNEGL